MIYHDTHLEFPVEVEIDHSPGEPMSRNYPGSPEENYIVGFTVKGGDPEEYKRVDFQPMLKTLAELKMAQAAGAGVVEVSKILGRLEACIKWAAKQSPSFDSVLQPVIDENADNIIEDMREDQIAKAEAAIDDRAEAEYEERKLRGVA